MKQKKYNVSKYMKSVREYIKKKYGEIPTEWDAILELLQDNLELYNECWDSIREHGIYNASRGWRHPLLATLKELQASIMKQIQHLGLSPYAAKKLSQEDVDDTDAFIERLVGGNG